MSSTHIDLILGGRDVVPVGDLLRAGITRHALARALARGQLIRARRGWVAVPDADPQLFAAARDGVVLTCVTQAARLGLWDVDAATAHVAAPSHAGRVAVDARVHWEKPLIRRMPGVLVDPVENVLAIVARCRPYEEALMIWNSALRRGIVDLAVLRRMPLGPAARALADEATPFADSGLESVAVPRLRWLRLPLRRQVWICGHRVDLLIGDRLILQIDGGHHVGRQRTSDNAHDAELLIRGYHVIRVGYDQVMNRWADVQDLVMAAVAQGLYRAR